VADLAVIVDEAATAFDQLGVDAGDGLRSRGLGEAAQGEGDQDQAHDSAA
jgi:hypothetical protein